MLPVLATFLHTAGGYLREIGEIVLLGFTIAGVINAIVNKEAVARYLGGGNIVRSNLLGATIGLVTPLCCCSAIPTAMSLYRAGSRRGPACAFLIATPWFNWYGLTALVIFLGPRRPGCGRLCRADRVRSRAGHRRARSASTHDASSHRSPLTLRLWRCLRRWSESRSVRRAACPHLTPSYPLHRAILPPRWTGAHKRPGSLQACAGSGQPASSPTSDTKSPQPCCRAC
jgi:hypothetical protein